MWCSDEKKYFEVVWSHCEKEEGGVWEGGGRPVVRWKDRVKEYMHKRVADRGKRNKLARIGIGIGRGGGSSAIAIAVSRGNETSETIDRYRKEKNLD